MNPLPADFVLSVIVPVFNERDTVVDAVARLRATGIPMQIVLVNDGSSDGSGCSVDDFQGDDDILVIHHPNNLGKGAAIRSAVPLCSGDLIVIQDADREYDPSDFHSLLGPLLAGEADVVYGSRYGCSDRHDSPWWHRGGNQLITALANRACGVRLTDIETCYKMAPREHFQAIWADLTESRFGIEIELTARWGGAGLRFAELPISYQHRSYDAGKKIGWKDAISAMRCIVQYGWLRR